MRNLNREGSKFREKIDTPFSDANMFENLHVEGQNDGDSTRSSSPDPENGGVSLTGNGLPREMTLMDSDIDEDFRASFDKSGILKLQPAEPASSFQESPPKSVPGELSRYYNATKQNEPTLPDHPEAESKENPWIPDFNSSFWNIYANKLRVYATETEVCNLGA